MTAKEFVESIFDGIAKRIDQFFKAKDIAGGVRCGDDMFSPMDKLELSKSIYTFASDEVIKELNLLSMHMRTLHQDNVYKQFHLDYKEGYDECCDDTLKYIQERIKHHKENIIENGRSSNKSL